VKRLTVGSSIIVSSLLGDEQRHKEARKIWDTVLAGKNVAILPCSVFVEKNLKPT
jgi:predicted nucleic acid-binding protein